MSGPSGLAQCVVSGKGMFCPHPSFLDIYVNSTPIVDYDNVKVTALECYIQHTCISILLWR